MKSIIGSTIIFEEVNSLRFIMLAKLRGKMSLEEMKRSDERLAAYPEVKFISMDYTLGRYDVVCVVVAPDEKTIMKVLIEFGDILSSETLVAVSREEIKTFL